MNWLMVAAIATLIAAGYLAALILALQGKRSSAVEKRFGDRQRPEAGAWLARNREAVLFSLSFLRTAARIGFFALVLVDIVGVGETAVLTLTDLFIAAGIAVLAVWLVTTIVALAVAQHVGEGLIVSSLPFLKVAAVVGKPLAIALSFIDEAVRRLSGANIENVEADKELLRSIEETSREGGLDPEAAAMLENVVEFRTTEVSEIMTPRTDIEGIGLTNDLGEIRAFIAEAGHSRIPVYEGDLDHIAGILYVKDLVPFLGSEPADFDLRAMLRKPIVIPETKPVRELLNDFQRSEVHLAIVIDEYGGTAGLVTIEDVLEEIVGEIHDEHEPEHEEVPTLHAIDDTSAEVDGRYHIDDLNEQLGLRLPEDDDYDTVAGFVMAQLGRVPAAGDCFDFQNARFTALRTTETHVQRVRIEIMAAAAANGADESHPNAA